MTGAAGIAGLAGCTEDSTGDGGDGGGGTSGGDGGTGNGTQSGDGGGSSGGQILLETAGGSPGGTGYAIMNAMLSGASAEYPKLTYNILPGGWVGNNTRLQNQEIDLGHTTLAAGTLAKNVDGPYSDQDWEQPPSNLRSVLADQSELFFFVVAQADFPYDTLTAAAEDDYAINVTNQPKGTFGGYLWDTVLENLNYSQSKIQELGGSYRRVGWNDAAQLFSDGQVDAILAVGGRDLGWLNNIASGSEVKYLNWKEEFRTQIKEQYGVLKADLEGVFPQQQGTLKCMQDSGLINTHKGVSEEAVYTVTKGVMAKADQIQQSTGLLSPFEVGSDMINPCPFEIHPGAVKAYKEEGVGDF
ncbi:TAXI family TRAP transporter solute-binding subunit [Haloarcula nitratireducens]|uniref:TAXI family TRAP transporter solute-binding subunit n=1 Tax=Haloarcula nitratireducens TaxID=2487749 RepID=A0AAW4PHB7_9EURY|nr:TAXI family TRAP transporter solute-binding subunit [Halomicroarcula nitratireducens]MBX0297420.1 hypothetical protein [Halomicroarcula nitratireducens]